TRDLNLGKVALYQLSYSREILPGSRRCLGKCHVAAICRSHREPRILHEFFEFVAPGESATQILV
ncbi:hypothetical protein, partial [Bordetella bronchiseptica]|uniref:hypothetical protein n=1 Tax=Bordetella bronchiseptica TaxID=518 RepID=UPI002FD9C11D